MSATILTALIGLFGTILTVLAGFILAKTKQNASRLEAIQITVNGNLSKVQADLAESILEIRGLRRELLASKQETATSRNETSVSRQETALSRAENAGGNASEAVHAARGLLENEAREAAKVVTDKAEQVSQNLDTIR